MKCCDILNKSFPAFVCMRANSRKDRFMGNILRSRKIRGDKRGRECFSKGGTCAGKISRSISCVCATGNHGVIRSRAFPPIDAFCGTSPPCHFVRACYPRAHTYRFSSPRVWQKFNLPRVRGKRPDASESRNMIASLCIKQT